MPPAILDQRRIVVGYNPTTLDFEPLQVVGGNTTFSPTPGSPTNATVSGTSAQAVAANTSRRMIILTNIHATQDIFLGLGVTAELNKGIPLMHGGGSLTIRASALFTGAINAIATGASTIMTVQEFT